MLLLVLLQSAILSPPPSPDAKSISVSQLSAPAASDTPIGQVSADTSRKAVQVQRITGRDRCEERARATERVCQRGMERRASRYTPTDRTPLSSDQRAVAERTLVSPRTDAAIIDQRIAQGDLDPNTPAAQDVATAASTKKSPIGNDPAETGLSDLQKAIISGVIVPGDVSSNTPDNQ